MPRERRLCLPNTHNHVVSRCIEKRHLMKSRRIKNLMHDVVNLALELYPGPVYVRKEIVHNVHVVNDLRGKRAIFVDELDEVPDGATVIFSAHGVSQAVRLEAEARGSWEPLPEELKAEPIKVRGPSVFAPRPRLSPGRGRRPCDKVAAC